MNAPRVKKGEIEARTVAGIPGVIMVPEQVTQVHHI